MNSCVCRAWNGIVVLSAMGVFPGVSENFTSKPIILNGGLFAGISQPTPILQKMLRQIQIKQDGISFIRTWCWAITCSFCASLYRQNKPNWMWEKQDRALLVSSWCQYCLKRTAICLRMEALSGCTLVQKIRSRTPRKMRTALREEKNIYRGMLTSVMCMCNLTSPGKLNLIYRRVEEAVNNMFPETFGENARRNRTNT